jgi:hypothetical protein
MKKRSARSRRQGGLRRAAAVAGAAVAGVALLAACGGSHPSAAGTGTGGMTRQQVDAYVHCMQGHGIANFYLSRPGTAAENGEIPIGLLPYGVVVGVDIRSPQFQSASNACQGLLPGGAPPPVTAAQLRSMDRAAACIRAHGFPDYPDPDVQNGQLVPNPLPTGIDGTSPQFMAALKTCGNPGL